MTQPDDDKNPFDVTAKLRSVEHLLTVHRGLYVQYFENRGADPVYDRNGESRGRGKQLVEPGGTTIKIGKFENGFLARRAQDAIHMHRRPASVANPPTRYSDEFVYAPALGTYLECLKRIYVLNLGSLPKAIVRRAEQDLRTDVDAFLTNHGLPVRDFLGDWRLLSEPVPADLLPMVDAWVRSEFERLRARYSAAPS